MSKLWSRGSWGRYLALFLAVVLALNTVSPAVKAEGFDQAEQAQEVQNETEVTNETEPAAEPTEENPDETDPAEEVTDEAPAEEDTEPAQEPTEEVTEPAETEPAEEVTEPAKEPTEEATEPAETEPAGTEPTEEATEPAAEPTEEVAEPVETEPAEEPTDEAADPAEPTEEDAEPVEDPTEDVMDPAEEQADDNEDIEINFTSPRYFPAMDGETVSLKIDAVAAGEIHYSWSKYAEGDDDWIDLPYETGEAQLSVYNTAENYSDTSVQCVVSDGYTSKTINFTIRVLSNLTDLTENEEFTARGDGLSSYFRFVPEETGVYSLISSSSEDNDPQCYLWEFTDEGIIEAAYNDDYEGLNFNLTENLTAGQTYVYRVSNRNTGTDIPISLRTAENYLVLKIPNDQYFYLEKGETVALEAIVITDSTELSYRWEKKIRGTYTQIENAEEPVYETDKPGDYECIVSDEYGKEVRAHFSVHLSYMPLDASPDWEKGGQEFTIQLGESAELNVAVTDFADQQVYYEWYRNYKLIENESSSSLNTNRPGTYICYVTDDYGNEVSVWFYVYLSYDGDTLSIDSSSPSFIIAKSGDTVSLKIEASSILGDVTYEWSVYNDNSSESVPIPADGGKAELEVNAEWDGFTYYVYCWISDGNMTRDFNFSIRVYQNLTELKLDEEIFASGGNDTSYFIFTPEETLAYSFAANVTGYSYWGDIYEIDEYGTNYINWQYDYNDDWNFVRKVKLEAGHQYLISFHSGMSEDYPVILTKAEHYLLLDMDSWNTIYLEEGETASLQAILLTDAENLEYTWHRENNSGSHRELMENVTGSSYETSRPGRYQVEIRDEYGNYENIWFEVFLSNKPLNAYADEEYGNSFNLEPGESATLKVFISEQAGQDIYYKWYRNEVLIEGEASDSIVATKAGEYYCDVYDDYGNEVSVSFSVQYNITFNVWAEQDWYSIPYGGQAELRVKYETDGQNLYFNWYYEDELIEENGIEVYRTNVGGSYTCIVTDDYGNEATVNFYVNAMTADDWGTAGTTKPSYDGLVSYGGDVTFEVSLENVDKSAVFTYAWYQLPDFSVIDDRSKWTLIENETTSALTWKNITGKIYVVCLVTDPFGASERVQRFEASVQNFLTVRAANDQQRFAVAEGESVTLEVLAYADDMEGLSYSWFELDKGSENVKWTELDNTGNSLTVTKIGATEQDYLCRVTDRFGSKEEVDFAVCSQNNLSVEAVNPYRFVEGGPETLEVVIHADDPEGITVTWYNEYGWPLEGTETTFAVEVYRNTIYSCCVKDRFGMEAWAYFERVTNKTWNLESSMLPENGKVNYGDSVSLSMDPVVIWYGTSSPNFTYRWYTTTNDQDETSWTELQEQGPYLTQTVTEHRFYKAVITDKFGLSEERIFDVTVENHLEIEDPEPETVAFGADVTFAAEVTADDTSEMSYVWYTMGENSGTSALQSVRTNDTQAGKVILSEDGPVYTAENVTYYKTIYLDVTDKYGNTETAEFICAVENHFTAEAEEAVVKTSYYGDAELRVVYSADNAEGMTFEWYSPYGSYPTEENSDRITAAEVWEDAAYYCLVTDCYGTTIRVDFTVQVDVTWDAELQYNEVVPLYKTAELKVLLTGDYNIDNFSFNWYSSNNGDYWNRIWGYNSNILETEVWFTTPRYYRCEISDENGYTKVLDAVIRGENNFAVEFVKGAQENIVPYGGEITIEFKASGNYLDDMRYSWLKYIEIGDRVEERDMGISVLSYTFTNVTQLAKYKFTADDGFGGRYETEFTISPESEPEVIYTLDKTALTISVGSQEKLTLVGSDGSVGTGTWTSSNEDVASVNENGLVTAKAVGKTTITAKIGDYTETCAVTVLFKDVAGSPVKDDPDYQYYYAPVYWAADNGITVGYSDGTFGVGKDCQRRELMIFLWRFAGEPTKDKNGKAYGDARTMFNDLKGYGTSTATNKAIAWAYKEGITKGYNDGGFHPTDSIVRKDVMIMLYRLAGKPSVSGSLKFTDCQGYNKTSDTYKAILWGSKNKITNGYTSGEYAGQFGVNLNCLREQIVTFLYRYNNLP